MSTEDPTTAPATTLGEDAEDVASGEHGERLGQSRAIPTTLLDGDLAAPPQEVSGEALKRLRENEEVARTRCHRHDEGAVEVAGVVRGEDHRAVARDVVGLHRAGGIEQAEEDPPHPVAQACPCGAGSADVVHEPCVRQRWLR